MCVEKYTLERRGFGQDAKRRARILRERTALIKTGKMQSIFPERVSANGVPKKCKAFFGGSEATKKTLSLYI